MFLLLNLDLDMPFLVLFVPVNSWVNGRCSLVFSVDIAIVFRLAASEKIATPIVEPVPRNMVGMVLFADKLLDIDSFAVDFGAWIAFTDVPPVLHDPLVIVDRDDEIFAKMNPSQWHFSMAHSALKHP